MPSSTNFNKIGKGPHLLFLHGWGQSKDNWGQASDLLSKNFTCWLVDLPGFGTNTTVLNDQSPQGYAKWVNDFAAANIAGNFYLLGHSFGGRIAIICATQNKSVKKLILYATPAYVQKTKKSKVISIIKKLGLKSSAISSLLRSQDYKNTTEANREIFLKAVNFNLNQYISKIAIPTLILAAQNDSEVSYEVAEKLNKDVKGSNLYCFPNTSHFAHLEKPLLFTAKIEEFLNG